MSVFSYSRFLLMENKSEKREERKQKVQDGFLADVKKMMNSSQLHFHQILLKHPFAFSTVKSGFVSLLLLSTDCSSWKDQPRNILHCPLSFESLLFSHFLFGLLILLHDKLICRPPNANDVNCIK